MNYVENNFYPAWLPQEMRDIVNRNELAVPTPMINEIASALMKILNVNIAIYSKGNKIEPGGLCSIYKSAPLNTKQMDILNKAEQEFKDYVIVAYTMPLEKHETN
jgi:predicted alternative tryptophan synthase beta-subunit